MECDTKNIVLNNDVCFILSIFKNCGYDARLIGGIVRDYVCASKISNDIDIATDAVPSEVIKILQQHDIGYITKGITHGTIICMYHGNVYEITTLRRDVKTFGRRASIEFSNSFEIDSTRRDFSMNALYMDIDGKLYDFHNGVNDLLMNNVKFIGNPETRIKEDYLRIFRYFRFTCSHGLYKCDENYVDIINRNLDGIKHVSSERIFIELIKIFSFDQSYKILESMREVFAFLFSADVSFLLRYEELGIYHNMTAYERIAALLLSNTMDSKNSKKFNIPKKISQFLRINCDADVNPKLELKKLAQRLRKFYIYYYCVMTSSKEDLFVLENYCNSIYIDFKIDHSIKFANNIDRVNCIRLAKKIWLEDENITGQTSVKIAIDSMKTDDN